MRRSWRSRVCCATQKNITYFTINFYDRVVGFLYLYRFLRVWQCCLRIEIAMFSWKLALNFEALNWWLRGSPFGRFFFRTHGIIFHSCTVHLDTIASFIYPTDAQLDCSKMLNFTLKFTWEVFLHVSVFHNHHQGATICISNQLKYVVYRIQPLDRTDSISDVF